MKKTKNKIKKLRMNVSICYRNLFLVTLISMVLMGVLAINLVTDLREKVRHNGLLVIEIIKKNNIINEYKLQIAKKKQLMNFFQFKLYIYENYNKNFDKLLEIVYSQAEQFKINPYLIMALIKAESNYNPYAKSRVAYGLMQINYNVWKEELKLDFSRIYEPAYNVEKGLEILQFYIKEAGGDIGKALHLYNNGYVYNNLKYVPIIQRTRAIRSFN